MSTESPRYKLHSLIPDTISAAVERPKTAIHNDRIDPASICFLVITLNIVSIVLNLWDYCLWWYSLCGSRGNFQ